MQEKIISKIKEHFVNMLHLEVLTCKIFKELFHFFIAENTCTQLLLVLLKNTLKKTHRLH